VFKIIQEFGFSGIYAAFAVVSATIVIFLYRYRHAKSAQEYKLKTSKEQLDSIVDLYTVTKDKNDNSQNRFVVEQVFNYKFKFYIQFAVIQILLDLDNPTEAIMNYKIGKVHLELNKENGKLEYREKMKSETYREKWKKINISLYFINSTIGVGIFFSAKLIHESLGYIAMAISFFYALIFLWGAFESGSYSGKILAAERLMKEISLCSTNKKI